MEFIIAQRNFNYLGNRFLKRESYVLKKIVALRTRFVEN